MISQEEPFKKNGKWDMIAIQEKCKKKYPIGIKSYLLYILLALDEEIEDSQVSLNYH